MYEDTRKKFIHRQPFVLSSSDYDYILEDIVRRQSIEFERDVEVYSDGEKNNMSI